jgi:hypothetical protein
MKEIVTAAPNSSRHFKTGMSHTSHITHHIADTKHRE